MVEIKRKSEYETKFVKGIKKTDDVFGEHYIYNSIESNEQIISVEMTISDKEEALKEIERVKRGMLLKHKNLITILDYSFEQQNNLCSSFFIIRVFYDYTEQTLASEIERRRGS